MKNKSAKRSWKKPLLTVLASSETDAIAGAGADGGTGGIQPIQQQQQSGPSAI